MSRNRGKDTGPEVALRVLCWSSGLRYRLDVKIIGKPDFVFVREKVAVFVDGCFWHGCPAHYNAPKTRSDFWEAKLHKNRLRDEMVTKELQDSGWLVLRYWEHDIKTATQREERVREIQAAIQARRAEAI